MSEAVHTWTDRFRCAVVALCTLLLVAVGAYSFIDHRPLPEAVSTQGSTNAARSVEADPMQAFKEERDRVRELETLRLHALSENEAAESAVRGAAQRMLMTLSEQMEQETTIEGILSMRGYPQTVATVHADSVNVVVRTDALTQAECAVILELVMRETGVIGGNVKIIPIGGD